MLSGKLVHLIESNWEEIVSRVVFQVGREPQLAHYRALVESELREWGQVLLENLGHWLTAPKDNEIGVRYEQLGKLRFEQGVPLHESVHCLCIVREKVLDFVEEHVYNKSSLELILNPSTHSGIMHRYAEADKSVPLSLAMFGLSEPFEVTELAKRVFKRQSISNTLGGSLATSFPRPNDGPTYACLNQSDHDLLPQSPGQHGIAIVKGLPPSLDKSGFSLFTKASKKSTDWTYCGKYKGTLNSSCFLCLLFFSNTYI